MFLFVNQFLMRNCLQIYVCMKYMYVWRCISINVNLYNIYLDVVFGNLNYFLFNRIFYYYFVEKVKKIELIQIFYEVIILIIELMLMFFDVSQNKLVIEKIDVLMIKIGLSD